MDVMRALRENLFIEYQLVGYGSENIKLVEQVQGMCMRWMCVQNIKLGKDQKTGMDKMMILFERSPDFKSKFEEKKIKASQITDQKAREQKLKIRMVELNAEKIDWTKYVTK